jgi:uncharacterized protein (DUF1697 family)
VPTYVALLRGINLGARHRVAMADLRGLLDGLGYGDVRTHLQSGNAVFTAPTRSGGTVRGEVEAALADRYDFPVPVVVRTGQQLAKVVDADPFGDVATDHARYLVQFADRSIPSGVVGDLDPAALAPERLVVSGREAYLWLPDGLQRSPLATAVDKRLAGLTVTMRNWRTVLALRELAGR